MSSATANGQVAVTVRDADQGRGLGTILLEHLAYAAISNGIHQFFNPVIASATGAVLVDVKCRLAPANEPPVFEPD